MFACYYDHAHIVSWLIQEKESNSGSEARARAKSLDRGRTAVMMAAMCGNEAVAHALIRRFGPAPLLEDSDKEGHTALFHACLCGHAGMTQLLLEAGANANAIDEVRHVRQRNRNTFVYFRAG